MTCKRFAPVQIVAHGCRGGVKKGCVMTVTDKRLGFGSGILQKMGYPPYVQFFFDKEGKRLALKPRREETPMETVRFSRVPEKQLTSVYLNTPELLRLVHDSMPNRVGKTDVEGRYDNRMKAFVFSLAN